MSKKAPRTPDFDGDFSFLGQTNTQQPAGEPAQDTPTSTPTAAKAQAPAPKAPAAKVTPLPPKATPQPELESELSTPPAPTTAVADTTKRGKSAVDIPVDFSFLGEPTARQTTPEPEPEIPTITPAAKAPVPAPKPAAAKAPPQPPRSTPQPEPTPPPAPAAPAAAPTPAASKRSRSSVDIPVDFSFLGEPAARQTTPEPEIPTITPAAKAPVPAPKPAAAKAPSQPARSTPQPEPTPPPTPAAPAVAAASPAVATERSRSSVDIPVDFSFLSKADDQQTAPVPEAAINLEPAIPEPTAEHFVPTDAADESQSDPESEAATEHDQLSVTNAVDFSFPSQAEDQQTGPDPQASINPPTATSELTVAQIVGSATEVPPQPASASFAVTPAATELPMSSPALTDLPASENVSADVEKIMNKRSSQSPDFSGDFSFLSDTPAAPQPLPDLSGQNESAEPVPVSVEPPILVPVTTASTPEPTAAQPVTAAAPAGDTSEGDTSAGEASAVPPRRANNISVPAWFPGYTAAITLVMLFLLLTGRIHLSSNHVLESLPDVRPLAPNEFKEVKASRQLPRGHVLALGESRRFGDVIVTPLKVTREPLEFQDFLTGKPAPTLTTPPAYKLHLRFENVASDVAFPPWDAALMSHRFPPFTDDLNTLANSFLSQAAAESDEFPERLLNYMQTMDSNFLLTGQNAGKVIAPGESLETWVASEPIPEDWAPTGQLRWRIQFRKGVNRASKNGVTTLIDVNFNVSEVRS
ncbi:MAG: hypothetical protein RLZZ436_2025 [Planctomycetota bacterium]